MSAADPPGGRQPAYLQPGPRARVAPFIFGALGLAVLLAVGAGLYRSATMTPEDRSRLAAAEARERAKLACERGARSSLHDPDSAQIEKSVVTDAADGYLVVVRLRARNAFNAVRLVDLVCETDRAGATVRYVRPLT